MHWNCRGTLAEPQNLQYQHLKLTVIRGASAGTWVFARAELLKGLRVGRVFKAPHNVGAGGAEVQVQFSMQAGQWR